MASITHLFRKSASFPELSITLPLIIIGVVGLFSLFDYNILPAGLILEASLFLSAGWLIRGCSKSMLAYSLISLAYVATSGVLAIYFRNVHILDFLQAYKAFIYIIPLAFFVNKRIIPKSALVSLFYLLLALFALKYTYSKLLDLTPRMGDRPGLYEENNFELIFLILLFYLASSELKYKLSVFYAVCFVVLISGSRSVFLGLAVVYLFTFSRKIDAYFLISTASLPFLAIIGGWLFLSRMDGGLEEVDRFKFMLVFLSEVQSWAWFEFLTGAPALTPLSNSSCNALAFYETLFSFSDDGTCYSVILHSYFFRVIFDHGALGFMFILAFIWAALKRSGYSARDSLCIYGVLLSSALSVSSFNSIFSALILAIFFSAQKSQSSKAT